MSVSHCSGHPQVSPPLSAQSQGQRNAVDLSAPEFLWGVSSGPLQEDGNVEKESGFNHELSCEVRALAPIRDCRGYFWPVACDSGLNDTPRDESQLRVLICSSKALSDHCRDDGKDAQGSR